MNPQVFRDTYPTHPHRTRCRRRGATRSGFSSVLSLSPRYNKRNQQKSFAFRVSTERKINNVRRLHAVSIGNPMPKPNQTHYAWHEVMLVDARSGCDTVPHPIKPQRSLLGGWPVVCLLRFSAMCWQVRPAIPKIQHGHFPSLGRCQTKFIFWRNNIQLLVKVTALEFLTNTTFILPHKIPTSSASFNLAHLCASACLTSYPSHHRLLCALSRHDHALRFTNDISLPHLTPTTISNCNLASITNKFI